MDAEVDLTALLSRRQALAFGGAVCVAVIASACGSVASTSTPPSAATASPAGTLPPGTSPSVAPAPVAPSTATGAGASCNLAPEVTQGPYFLTDHPQASNLVQDRQGVPLALTLRVVNAACVPIAGAKVDIWHCDAAGEYGGISGGGAPPQGGSGGAAVRGNAKNWLQGYQTAGSDGTVRFATIFPGWYRGRAVHIHMKVFVGGTSVHIGQLFFPDDLTANLFKNAPYRGTPDTLNGADSIFASAGSAALVTPSPSASGYAVSAQLVVRA